MTHDPWPLHYFILRMGLVVLDSPLGLESKQNGGLKLSLQL